MLIVSGVTHIGDYSVNDDSGLTNITVAGGNLNYASVKGVLFKRNQSGLIQYPGGLAGSYVVPGRVMNVAPNAFDSCSLLTGLLFGDGTLANGPFSGVDQTTFPAAKTKGTVYYELGTTGWGTTFGSWPTSGWYNPQPQIHHHVGLGGGVSGGTFGFTVARATNISVVVEASPDLPGWTPISTNVLMNGTNDFNDPDAVNHRQRF